MTTDLHSSQPTVRLYYTVVSTLAATRIRYSLVQTDMRLNNLCRF